MYARKVRRSSSVLSNTSTATASTSEENLTNSVENITDSIFVEASESYIQNTSQDEPDEPLTSDSELTEEEQIIREMDRDLPDGDDRTLRRRNVNQSSADSQPSTSTPAESSQQKDEDRISIKLKYLNDEIKTVSAWKNETVGNFKR